MTVRNCRYSFVALPNTILLSILNLVVTLIINIFISGQTEEELSTLSSVPETLTVSPLRLTPEQGVPLTLPAEQKASPISLASDEQRASPLNPSPEQGAPSSLPEVRKTSPISSVLKKETISTALPENKTTPVLNLEPEEPKTMTYSLLAEEQTSAVLQEEQRTSPITPEQETSLTSPEEQITPQISTLPENETTPLLSRDKQTASPWPRAFAWVCCCSCQCRK